MKQSGGRLQKYTEGVSALASPVRNDAPPAAVPLVTPAADHAAFAAAPISPRPLRADARRNYDALLTAASASFAEQGPEAPLEQIARRAGVGIGTLYRHFPTRESLMAAVVRETFEDLEQRASDGLDADDPWQSLAQWVRAYLAFASTKRGLVAGIVLLKEGDGEFGRLCDRMFAAVDALVVRGQAAGVVRTGVDGRDLLHLAGGIAHSAEHAGDPSLTDRLLDLALAGLHTEPDEHSVAASISEPIAVQVGAPVSVHVSVPISVPTSVRAGQ